MDNHFLEQVKLIAPCGMNCAVCIAYLREKNTCPGCNIESKSKATYCQSCIIKNCEHIKTNASGFCYDCPTYPCKRLKQLDKRYRGKYHMSMIENLNYIKEQGLEKFIKKENQKWRCSSCNGQLSAHRNTCLECGKEQSWPF